MVARPYSIDDYPVSIYIIDVLPAPFCPSSTKIYPEYIVRFTY